MSYNVHVSGIAPATTESNLHDFFTFCGKIVSIDFNEKAEPKSAVIHFEKPSAVKTALMLNGGTLDGAHLTVASETEHPDFQDDDHDKPIDQTDKPKAAIVAEYLAKGYTLSDSILQRAIETDQKNGISKRFLSYINTLDQTLGSKALGPDQTISGKVTTHVTAGVQQAKAFDESKGISARATDIFHQYYSKALASPVGLKVRTFYTTTSKQVLDIHEEALRIKGQNAPAAAPAPVVPETTGAPVPETGVPTTAAPTVV